MRFGVNYTPSCGWFHAWLRPDWDSVQRDLDDIGALGLDHIRIFPLWPVLQPNRTMINPSALDDIRRMVGLAGRRGLDVYVDVLQGHLSSFDFLPSWLVTWHRRNMFTDPQAVAAEAELVAAVYGSLDDLPNFKGLTLGNECNQFAEEHHPAAMSVTPEQAGDWIDSLLAPVRQEAAGSGRVLLHSENDAVWYEDGHCFNPRHAARKGDITAIHSWVFNGTAQRYGARSEIAARHAEYLVELARAFSPDPDRPIWLQEIGAPGNVIEAGDEADFCEATVRHAAGCRGLYGITWWCSHDVASGMGDFPPFEHHLGLFDEGRRLKPIGRVFASLAKEDGRGDDASPDPRTTAIVIPCDDAGVPTKRSACAPGGSLFDRWMALSQEGGRPTFVTSIDAADPSVMAKRKIDRLVRVEARSGDAYGAVSDPSLLHQAVV